LPIDPAQLRRAPGRAPVVALIPWGFAIEDFLEPNGLTFDTFCRQFRGSWMFGYVDALLTAGIETLLVCFARSVRTPSRRIHEPTGARILALPLPRAYRGLRRTMADPYGRTTRQMFGAYRGLVGWPVLGPIKELAPYLSTPVRPLVRELRREHVDAMLCQEYEFPRFDICVLSKWLHDIPVFGVFQGGDYRRWWLERILRPRAIRMCDGVIAGAQAEIDRVTTLYGPPQRKLARIPNPVDVRLWCPSDGGEARSLLELPEGARVVVWHGRVQLPKKGLDVLLEAWAMICREDSIRELRLIFVGAGEDATLTAAAIARSGLDNIVFVNRLLHDPAELRTYLAAADVYVFPSRHEGFAVAPIEAMACGLAVVATDTGGMADILGTGHEASGIIVPREDPQALAEGLRRLLHDDELSRLLGQRARRRAIEEFSLEAVGAKLRRFLFHSSRAGLG
jgi:glycosyltransferase involved in cell wall biosynthesis